MGKGFRAISLKLDNRSHPERVLCNTPLIESSVL